jgi:phospholipid N-methyltransferase
MLGSLVPSSRFLISRILRQADWARTRLVIEAGPGVGTVTTAILDRLGTAASLVAFEMNRTFVTHLQTEIPDPRFTVLHRSAADAEAALSELGVGCADVLISGIPLSGFSRSARRDLLAGWRRVLRPGGVLVIYQFTRSALPDLKHLFGQVRQEFEPLNVLPARVFRCVT